MKTAVLLVALVGAVGTLVSAAGYSNVPVVNRPSNGFFFGSFAGISDSQQGNTAQANAYSDDSDIYTGFVSFDGTTNTFQDSLSLMEDGGVLAIAQNPTNGNIFIGGYFKTLGSAEFNSIAEWDGEKFTAIGEGLFLESQVFALYHNGTHLFVGGCFSAPYSQSLYYNSANKQNIVMWYQNEWIPMQGGGGLNGCVGGFFVNGTDLWAYGDFTGSNDYNNWGDDITNQIILPGITAFANNSAAGNFSASNILKNNASNPTDGPGYIWLLPKYAVENDLDTTLTIDFDAVVPLQKIRIANTQFNGAGTASFTVTYSTDQDYNIGPFANVLTLAYYNPLQEFITCTTNCMLFHNPNSPYTDFYATYTYEDPYGEEYQGGTYAARAIAITVSGEYNYTAGIAAVELFTFESFAAAKASSSDISLNTTGTWALSGTSPYQYYATTVSSSPASAVVDISINAPGAYNVNMEYICPTTATSCSEQVTVEVLIDSVSVNTTSYALAVGLAPGDSDYISILDAYTLPLYWYQSVQLIITPTGSGSGFGLIEVGPVKLQTTTNLNSIAIYDLTSNAAPKTLQQPLPVNTDVGTINYETVGSTNVVIAGEFTIPLDFSGYLNPYGNASTYAYNLIQYNTATSKYQAYGGLGLSGEVFAVLPLPGTELFAVGGYFTTIANTTYQPVISSNIVFYNTSSQQWINAGQGVNSYVFSLFATEDALYIGGEFSGYYQQADFAPTELISSNLLTVYSFATGSFETFSSLYGGYVYLIAPTNDDETTFIFAGQLRDIANTPVNSIGQNIGSSSSAEINSPGGGFSTDYIVDGVTPVIYTAAAYNNQWFVGGELAYQGSVFNYLSNIAYYNGSAWLSPANGVDDTVYALTPANGLLWIGGAFTATVDPYTNEVVATVNGLAAFDGVQIFSPAPLLDGFNEDGVVVTSIIQSNGYVVVAGTFEYAGTVLVNNIAAWDGSNWYSLGGGVYSTSGGNIVSALATTNEFLIVGGNFIGAGNIPAYYLAVFNFNNGRWSAIPDSNYDLSPVFSIAVDNGINSFWVASENQVTSIVNMYLATEIEIAGVQSISIESASNTVSTIGISSGNVVVAYGSIQLYPNLNFNYGSVIIDGFNLFPETYVQGTNPVVLGFANFNPPSGLATWAIAIAVVFSVVGAALIGGLAFFIYKKLVAKK